MQENNTQAREFKEEFKRTISFLRPDAYKAVTWVVLGLLFPAPFTLLFGIFGLIPLLLPLLAIIIGIFGFSESSSGGWMEVTVIFGFVAVQLLILYACTCFIVDLLRKRIVDTMTVWLCIAGLAIALLIAGCFPIYIAGDLGGGKFSGTLVEVYREWL